MTAHADSARVRAIHVRAGGIDAAVPLLDVVETCRPLVMEPVADAPAGVTGVVRWRGVATPVVDLARLLGAAEPAAVTRFVVLHVGERSVALAVGEVVGIVDLDAHAALPPLLSGADTRMVRGLEARDGVFVRLLESARLLPPDAGG